MTWMLKLIILKNNDNRFVVRTNETGVHQINPVPCLNKDSGLFPPRWFKQGTVLSHSSIHLPQ
jgi:hypothetical protein